MISGRSLVMTAVAALALGSLALPAVADPTDAPSQEQVDAARAAAAAKARTVPEVQAQLDAANQRLAATELAASQAAEAANGARWRLELAETDAQKAEADERQARRTLRGHKAAYADLIARTYEEQPELHALSALASKARPQEMVNSASTTYQLSAAMDDIEAGYRAATAAAESASDRADAARDEAAELAANALAARERALAAADAAATEADAVAQEKQALIADLAELQDISVELATERQLALEEEQRRAAAAQAAAQAEAAALPTGPADADGAPATDDDTSPTGMPQPEDQEPAAQPDPATPAVPAPAPSSQPSTDPDPKPEPAPAPPPAPTAPTGNVEAVVAYAKAQLGDWYLWGAAGPDRWDCSGLTMMAFRQAGISLPHYSVAQYDAGTPISVTAAQRGDLLFWTSNGRASGIHHVAIYLGGGQVIEAARAGTQVRIRSLEYWYPDLAVRL